MPDVARAMGQPAIAPGGGGGHAERWTWLTLGIGEGSAKRGHVMAPPTRRGACSRTSG